MAHPNLDAIIALGDRMIAALEKGDLDGFGTLVRQRDALVRSLSSDRSQTGSESMGPAADVLTRQHARIDAAMDKVQTALREELGVFRRFRAARRAYGRRSGPAGRLNKSLQG